MNPAQLVSLIPFLAGVLLAVCAWAIRMQIDVIALKSGQIRLESEHGEVKSWIKSLESKVNEILVMLGEIRGAINSHKEGK